MFSFVSKMATVRDGRRCPWLYFPRLSLLQRLNEVNDLKSNKDSLSGIGCRTTLKFNIILFYFFRSPTKRIPTSISIRWILNFYMILHNANK